VRVVRGRAVGKRPAGPGAELNGLLVLVDEMQVADEAVGQDDRGVDACLEELGLAQGRCGLTQVEQRLQTPVAAHEIAVGGIQLGGPGIDERPQVIPVQIQLGLGEGALGHIRHDRNDIGVSLDLDRAIAHPDMPDAAVLVTMQGVEIAPAIPQDHAQAIHHAGQITLGLDIRDPEPGEFLAAVAERLAGGVVELDETGRLGVDQNDAVARLNEDGAIDLLALAQGILGLAQLGDVHCGSDRKKGARPPGSRRTTRPRVWSHTQPPSPCRLR
jgi:hypothetical protein